MDESGPEPGWTQISEREPKGRPNFENPSQSQVPNFVQLYESERSQDLSWASNARLQPEFDPNKPKSNCIFVWSTGFWPNLQRNLELGLQMGQFQVGIMLDEDSDTFLNNNFDSESDSDSKLTCFVGSRPSSDRKPQIRLWNRI